MKSKRNRELKAGIVLSYALIGINIVSGFLLVPFIIRSLGSSNYGIYTSANSFIAMFMIDFGLGTAVTKFVSKYRATSTQAEIDNVINVIKKCFIILASVFAVLFLAMYFFLDDIYAKFTPEELSIFKVVFIMIASYSVLSFPFSILNGLLVAYDKIFLSKIADIISKLVFIIFTVIVLSLQLNVIWLTACFLLHGFVGIVLKIVFSLTKTPVCFFKSISYREFKTIFKEVFSFSFWASINTFGRVLLISIVPAVLGYTSGTKEISVFSVAYQIESYVALFATTFGSIFYPSISRVLFYKGELSEKNKADFVKFHIKIARIQAMILLLVNIGLVICGKKFLLLWVGNEYSDSYLCMLLICLPSVLFYPLQTAENAMAAIDKIKHCAIGTLISTAVGFVLLISLSFQFGAIGASIGVCAGEIIRTILFNVSFKKHLSLKPMHFLFKTYFSFLLATGLAALAGIITNSIFSEISWLHFLVAVLVVSLLYILVLSFTGLSKDEKNSANNALMALIVRTNNFVEKI